MDRDYVVSTNVRSIGYDAASATLEVEFQNSFIYQYYNVPAQVYEALMASPSKGQFLNSQIKNMYAFSRV
jgi:KTSC domain